MILWRLCHSNLFTRNSTSYPALTFYDLWLLKIILFICFQLCWVFVLHGLFSPVAVSGGYSLVVVLRLLLVAACNVVDPRLWGTCTSAGAAHGLGSCGSWALSAVSVVVAHGPSCSMGCGIFPDQRLNPCLLHWQADSLPLIHQGSLIYDILNLWQSSPLKLSHHFFFNFLNVFISQAKILECIAISFSRGSSQPGIEPASPVSPALQACSLLTETWGNTTS